MDEFDRWSRMISALLPPVAKAASHHSGEHQEGRSCDKRYNESLIDYRRGSLRTASAFSRTRVGLIEKQTETSMLVSWSDPTLCRYLDQIWISTYARRGGYCALSGQVIRRGDLVFKPRWRGRTKPANSTEMILAKEIEQITAGD
jgi:hypothetical protein